MSWHALKVSTPQTDPTTHRRWDVTEADWTTWTSSFTPPQTRTQVQDRYPGADIQVIDEIREADPEVSGALLGTYLATHSVTCGGCQHWRKDSVVDGSGLGTCAIAAPASLKPGSLWPDSPHRCRLWEERSCPAGGVACAVRGLLDRPPQTLDHQTMMGAWVSGYRRGVGR